ncbi:hypothetical protein BASA81_010263 [Batrachochytrium salamandrivorans]|nr:hypothetical protein BASA81_010263 [Batrachochytrium salamandrivorans]
MRATANEEEIDQASLGKSLVAANKRSREWIAKQIQLGRWDLVLPEATLGSEALAMDVFEHVFRHLMHFAEVGAARAVLENSHVLGTAMREKFPKRYGDLAMVLNRKQRAFEGGEEDLIQQRLGLCCRLLPPLSEDMSSLEDGLGTLQSVIPPASKRVKTSKPKLGKGVHMTCAVADVPRSRLLVGTSDGFVERFVWDTLEREEGGDDAIFVDLAVTAVGASASLVVVGDERGGLSVFCGDTNQLLVKVDTGFPVVCGLCLSGDGDKVAVLGGKEVCRIFSTKTGNRLCDLVSSAPLTAVHFSSNQVLMTGANTGQVVLWNPSTGERVKELFQGEGKITKFLSSSPTHLWCSTHRGRVYAINDQVQLACDAGMDMQDFGSIQDKEGLVVISRQGQWRRFQNGKFHAMDGNSTGDEGRLVCLVTIPHCLPIAVYNSHLVQ